MVSTHAAVHIGGSDFMTVHPMLGKKPISDIEAHLLPSTKTALDELLWWARATMAARAAAETLRESAWELSSAVLGAS